MIVKNEQSENTIVYKVGSDYSNMKLKEYLRKRLRFSSRLLAKLKRDESIFVNDKYTKYHQIVKEGDIIKAVMREDDSVFEGEDLPFQVVYEDVDIIIINKKAGMVTHPTKSHPISTIANAAQYYLDRNNLDCKIRFVNRLDKETSGLLIIAKNPYAHHVLSEQMQNNLVEKKYIAFVEGLVEKDYGTINKPIYRPSFESIKRAVDPRGQESITKYKVIKRYKDTSKLEVELITGRTHQIRVHMDHMGHTLIGDSLYESSSDLIDRQALHASYLKFYQPRYGNHIEIMGDLPEDLKELEGRLDV